MPTTDSYSIFEPDIGDSNVSSEDKGPRRVITRGDLRRERKWAAKIEKGLPNLPEGCYGGKLKYGTKDID